MISALLIGRKGSVGFPKKNTFLFRGKPMAFYPMDAALKVKYVDKVFMSTDDDDLRELARKHAVTVIERPAYLCTNEALGEDVFVHGAKWIAEKNGDQELIVLLHCNAPTVLSSMIDEGIRVLRENPFYDSAVSVSRYNMWSPLRARRINAEGLLQPFVPFEAFGDPKKINCDRDSQGDVYFADMALSIVRMSCIQNIHEGLLPQRWMGKRVYPLKQEAGCDVDYEWQIPQVEYWLNKNLPVTKDMSSRHV
ncbi:MAG: cytidylyltransferase [Omnitrophica WOR_2 bacterium RIFCSPHIGHO2_02_FULL_50_17]|nr:MAG: cytidylyltransferase [Omnitrophica WOR_2 bacterium RIFCSPHIGHO2_02_FULL_50_17]